MSLKIVKVSKIFENICDMSLKDIFMKHNSNYNEVRKCIVSIAMNKYRYMS